MIPTESLMDPMSWMFQYVGFWKNSEEPHPKEDAFDFFKTFQQEVQSNFNAYQLPVINLEASTPKEAVCTVFEKVNTGGVPLNVFELATASFAADAEDSRCVMTGGSAGTACILSPACCRQYRAINSSRPSPFSKPKRPITSRFKRV